MCAQEWLRNLSILEKNWWVWLSYIIYNVYMTRTIIKESGKVHTPCFLYYYNFCLCKIYQISLVLFYTRFWESGCKGMTFFSTDQILIEKSYKKNRFFVHALTSVKPYVAIWVLSYHFLPHFLISHRNHRNHRKFFLKQKP